MITPLSRGSSFADGFDDLEGDGHSEWDQSIYTEIDDFLISDSESAVTKISDSSVWTTSKLISVNNQVNNGQNGQIEPLHMDYIIMKLMNDSLPKLEAKVKQLESIYRDVDSIKEKSNLSNSTQGSIQGSTSNTLATGTRPPPIKMSKRAKSEPIIGERLSLRVEFYKIELDRNFDFSSKRFPIGEYFPWSEEVFNGHELTEIAKAFT